MNIEFSSEITDINGTVIEENGKPLTLGNVVSSACAIGIPDGKIPDDNPLRAGELAMMLYSANSFDVSAQDIALIQKRLPFRWAPHVQFQAHTLLEGKTLAEEADA